MKMKSTIALVKDGAKPEFDKNNIKKRSHYEPELLEFLKKDQVIMEAWAAAVRALNNNVSGSILVGTLISENGVDEGLVTVIVDDPSMEINQKIQKLVRESHVDSEKLLKVVSFSL